MLLLGSLLFPAIVAAAAPTYGITQSSPTPSTVAYSDLVTFHGAYTCVNGADASAACPTSSQTQTATFALRPSGGATFTNVATVTSVFTFTSSSSGCPTTCTRAFQVQWKAGRAGSLPVAPGTYDVRLTTTLTADEAVLLSGLVITTESTSTTYTGGLSGDEQTSLALAASVADADRGLSAGTGVWSPDVYLANGASVSFSLYDATNTTLVVGPITAALSSLGTVTGSPTMTLPTAGSYMLRTGYSGNAYYDASSDLDAVSVNVVNTPPSLSLPDPITAEATSGAGAVVTYTATATDAEDDPDPTPACVPASGATFPLGTTSVECTVTDSGGKSTSGPFDVTVVDTTSPIVTVTTAEAAGASGWYNAASNDGQPGVTVDVSASDLVGVVSLLCTDNGAVVSGLTTSGGSVVLADGTHDVACTAADGAGNTADATASFAVDQTAPTAVAFGDGVAISGGLLDGGSYLFGSVPPGPTSCSADYDVSGPGACVVTGYSDLVGSQTVTATATDAAGNPGTLELHYTVLPWTLVGFAKPIDMTGVNAEKAGHQVRLKFDVWAGSTQLTSPDVVASFTETQVSCSTGAPLAVPRAATTKTDLQVDASGTFILTWLTPSAPGTCWRPTVTTLDGSSLSATFQLR